MEDNSEWQDRANQVAKCDFIIRLLDICLIFEAIGLIGYVYAVEFYTKIASEDYFKDPDFSGAAVVTFNILAIFIILLDWYAVKRLIIATKEKSRINLKIVLLFESRIWYYLNVVVLVFAVLFELYYMEQTNILAFVFVVSMRVYMLYVIHRYVEDFKKIIGTNGDSVHLVSGINDSNEI